MAKRRPTPVVVSGNNDGVVQTVVTNPGHQGYTVVHAASSSNRALCVWKVIFFVDRLPLPNMPYKGTWYGEFCGGTDYKAVVWVPDQAANRPPVRQTPAALAQQAVNRLPLPE